MQQTAQTEADLQSRLAAVDEQIARGGGDLAAFEEQERLKRQIKAAGFLREQAADRANREARAAATAELDHQADKVMVEIGTHAARLVFALQDFDKLVNEIMSGHMGSNGRSFEAIFGVDHEFAKRILAAILAENLELDFNTCLDGGKGGRPIPKKFALVMPRFHEIDVFGNPVGTKYL